MQYPEPFFEVLETSGDFKYPQELRRAYLNLLERERERIGAAVLERAAAPRLLLLRRRLLLRIIMRIIINIASMATAISTQNSHGEPVSLAPGSNIRGLSEGLALIIYLSRLRCCRR